MECRLARRVNGYGQRANRQIPALNLVFAKHSDSHAASMVDCGVEGEC